MPRANVDTGLDDIIQKYKFQHNQASRQLLKWKAAKFQNSQVRIILDPGDIEKSISESLSMPLEAFMTKFLDDIFHGRDVVSGSTDLSLFCQSVQKNPSELAVVKFIHENPAHECNSILVSYFQKLSETAGELFPKSAAKLTKVDLEFLVQDDKQKRILLEKWKALHPSIKYPPDATQTVHQFGTTGMLLFNILFGVWTLLLVEDERAEVKIVDKDLVCRHSLEVVYYVAGWMLQSASLALTKGRIKREIYK